MSTAPRQPFGLPLWSALVVLGVLAVAAGWDRGPDVLVDFGRELYVPWRLTEGDVLHRDIAWFNGPLAPWVLEGWMRLFGVSLDAVQALNALVIAATTLLLVRLIQRATGRLAAFAGGVTFLTVFAVAQQEAIGNFHFLSPYSHGITFGFLAALVALETLLIGLGRGPAGPPSKEHETRSLSARWFFLSGAAAGAAFLTKAEISLATGAACGLGLVTAFLIAGSFRRWLAAFAAFQLGAALVVGAAYLRLNAQLDGEGAFRALLGTWPHALDSRANGLDFYREMRGTADLPASLTRMALWSTGIAAFCAAVLSLGGALGGRLAPRASRSGSSSSSSWAIPAAAFTLAAAATAAALSQFTIQWLLLPLPAVLAVRIAFVARRWWQEKGNRDHAARLTFLVLSLALLPKVLFAPMARQYGFVLAVPGTLVMVALLVHCLPHWTSHSQGKRWTRWLGEGKAGLGVRRRAMAAAGLGIVAVFCAANVHATRGYFTRKTVAVGEGRDRLWSDGFRGVVINAVLREVETRTSPTDRVLVLPEGILVNYLARRQTPTSLVNFMPPELVFFDESEIVSRLESNPPSLVVIVKRTTVDYGYPFFGQGYGETLFSWVEEHYGSVQRIGSDPFDPNPKTFGAEIWLPR